MELETCAPPGFRFHPTEEELVGYYLRRKVASQRFDIEVITEIDLYNIEPWDLQDRCKLGYDEQKEWYFFCHKDRKYPSGARTNRATAAGFWKATGRDKAIVLSRSKSVIGMRKTLVFYQGRAPNGRKSDWIMHEYRLQSAEQQGSSPPPSQEEGWVVCRAFRKQSTSPRTQCFSNCIPADCFLDRYQSHYEITQMSRNNTSYSGDFSHKLQHSFELRDESEEDRNVHEIPQLLESPCFSSSGSFVAQDCSYETGNVFIDWKKIDKLLASQLAESPSCSYSNMLMNCADSGMSDDENVASLHCKSFNNGGDDDK